MPPASRSPENPASSRRRRPRGVIGRLERRLANSMGRAIVDWSLIEEGDHILAGVSGGKDSYTLIHLLRRFQERSPVSFRLTAVHIDQGQPGFDASRVVDYLESEGFATIFVRKDTYRLVLERLEEGETTCSLCSRYRRGILYRLAREHGCNKLALGHHREDAIETLLLNLFYSGRLSAMPARLLADEGRIEVIRPLITTPEPEILEYANGRGFPIEPCRVCGDTERDQVGALIRDLAARNPKVPGNLLSALHRVVPSHLLDPSLHG